MTRASIVWTGLIGLAGAVILTGLCLFVMNSGWIPVLLNQPIHVYGLFAFLFFFSVIEIPVMIFAMRRMAASVNPRAKYVALITNTGYTFFAAIYAAPFILLAGQSSLELAIGCFMGALSLVRFITSLVFLPYVEPT